MIENPNSTAVSGEFLDVKRYKGVASIHVLAINPDNATLRNYGWKIAEDAKEPEYVKESQNEDGTVTRRTRVRLLVQIMNLKDKPVIPLEFLIRPEPIIGQETGKYKIIDSFGRTAWGLREEVTARKIPQYSNGPADIAIPYKACHLNEAELIAFFAKYCNITPTKKFNEATQEWEATKNPGRITVDDWQKLCTGDMSELRGFINLPVVKDNCVKVVLGIKTDENNKSYQVFVTGDVKDGCYIHNAVHPETLGGEYKAAKKAIAKFMDGKNEDEYIFSAKDVEEWTVTASSVSDNSQAELPCNTKDDEDDLPFD